MSEVKIEFKHGAATVTVTSSDPYIAVTDVEKVIGLLEAKELT